MLPAGVPGDGHTYAALTRGYAQAGDLPRALGVLDHMAETGYIMNTIFIQFHQWSC